MTVAPAFTDEEMNPVYAQVASGVTQKRNSPYMDYPRHVHFETFTQCPAACNFCPYPTLDRQGERMSDELIHKIISDLTDIPKHVPFQLSPFKVNEPFLDTRIFDILKTINRKLPHANITLTSNASPITPKALAKLARIENIEGLWISFNDHRPQQYEATMQLPWARTEERLNTIHQWLEDGRLNIPVNVSRVGDRSEADRDYVNYVKDRYPLFVPAIFQRGGWLGQVDGLDPNIVVPDIPCGRWFELSIISSGKVAHCCMDGKCEWSIGDVNHQHVLDVYNHPDYRKLREQTESRRDAEPCNTCTFL